MHDDPLNQPGGPRKPAPFDAVILWGMVVLFGLVWVLMVWMNRHPGDAMTDPMSTGAPVGQVDPTVQSALLGMGLAIIGVGFIGGARDYILAARARDAERRDRGAETPGVERGPAANPSGPAPAVSCPVCHREAPHGSRFCPHCGAAL